MKRDIPFGSPCSFLRACFLLCVGLACPVSMSAPAFGAVSVPQAQILRPKVKVTFDRESFQVSYGKMLDLCMKIVPRTRFKPLITFDSNPPGVIEGKFGGSATCPDSSYDKIQIQASLSGSDAAASLLIKVKGKTVVGGALPGTVLLPDKTSARILAGFGGCGDSLGAREVYCVRFGNSTPGSAPNFDGLEAREDLMVDPDSNGCGMLPIPAATPWVVGSGPCSTSNEIDDANGKCGLPANCTTIIHQNFQVGNANDYYTTPTIVITVNMVNGVGTVTRSDAGGQ